MDDAARRFVERLLKGLFWVFIATLAIGLVIVGIMLLVMLIQILTFSSFEKGLLIIGVLLVFMVVYWGLIWWVESHNLANWNKIDGDLWNDDEYTWDEENQ